MADDETSPNHIALEMKQSKSRSFRGRRFSTAHAPENTKLEAELVRCVLERVPPAVLRHKDFVRVAGRSHIRARRLSSMTILSYWPAALSAWVKLSEKTGAQLGWLLGIVPVTAICTLIALAVGASTIGLVATSVFSFFVVGAIPFITDADGTRRFEALGFLKTFRSGRSRNGRVKEAINYLTVLLEMIQLGSFALLHNPHAISSTPAFMGALVFDLEVFTRFPFWAKFLIAWLTLLLATFLVLIRPKLPEIENRREHLMDVDSALFSKHPELRKLFVANDVLSRLGGSRYAYALEVKEFIYSRKPIYVLVGTLIVAACASIIPSIETKISSFPEFFLRYWALTVPVVLILVYLRIRTSEDLQQTLRKRHRVFKEIGIGHQIRQILIVLAILGCVSGLLSAMIAWLPTSDGAHCTNFGCWLGAHWAMVIVISLIPATYHLASALADYGTDLLSTTMLIPAARTFFQSWLCDSRAGKSYLTVAPDFECFTPGHHAMLAFSVFGLCSVFWSAAHHAARPRLTASPGVLNMPRFQLFTVLCKLLLAAATSLAGRSSSAALACSVGVITVMMLSNAWFQPCLTGTGRYVNNLRSVALSVAWLSVVVSLGNVTQGNNAVPFYAALVPVMLAMLALSDWRARQLCTPNLPLVQLLQHPRKTVKDIGTFVLFTAPYAEVEKYVGNDWPHLLVCQYGKLPASIAPVCRLACLLAGFVSSTIEDLRYAWNVRLQRRPIEPPKRDIADLPKGITSKDVDGLGDQHVDVLAELAEQSADTFGDGTLQHALTMYFIDTLTANAMTESSEVSYVLVDARPQVPVGDIVAKLSTIYADEAAWRGQRDVVVKTMLHLTLVILRAAAARASAQQATALSELQVQTQLALVEDVKEDDIPPSPSSMARSARASVAMPAAESGLPRSTRDLIRSTWQHDAVIAWFNLLQRDPESTVQLAGCEVLPAHLTRVREVVDRFLQTPRAVYARAVRQAMLGVCVQSYVRVQGKRTSLVERPLTADANELLTAPEFPKLSVVVFICNLGRCGTLESGASVRGDDVALMHDIEAWQRCVAVATFHKANIVCILLQPFDFEQIARRAPLMACFPLMPKGTQSDPARLIEYLRSQFEAAIPHDAPQNRKIGVIKMDAAGHAPIGEVTPLLFGAAKDAAMQDILAASGLIDIGE